MTGCCVFIFQSTKPWYVRCIKPNMNKTPDDYDEKMVLDQLRYLGMLEIIRIRKMGFPVHFTFVDFVSRYKCILDTQQVRRMRVIWSKVRGGFFGVTVSIETSYTVILF